MTWAHIANELTKGVTWANAITAAMAVASFALSWRTYTLQKRSSRERIRLTCSLEDAQTTNSQQSQQLKIAAYNEGPMPVTIDCIALATRGATEFLMPKWVEAGSTLPVRLQQGERAFVVFHVGEIAADPRFTRVVCAIASTASGRLLKLSDPRIGSWVRAATSRTSHSV